MARGMTSSGDAPAKSCGCQRVTAISSSAPSGRHAGRRFGARHLLDPWAWLALGGGSGLAPVAPGTAGSLLAVALWWLLLADLPWPLQGAAALVAFAVGWLALTRVGQRYSAADEPAFVIDEIVGCWVALASVPKSWPWVVAAFALFRLADIVKPWPISWADQAFAGTREGERQPRMPLRALGIMLDDLLAGVLVAALLLAAQAVFVMATN